MFYLKLVFYSVLAVVLAGFLHYSLPNRDIVYITGQEVKRQDTQVTGAGGQSTTETRDVNFIYAADEKGQEFAFRNEDTDWGWPPYFKFDTADIAARASNAISNAEDPKWMIVTTYGWRLRIFSMFPNVVGLEHAPLGPETRLIPWFNIVVVAVVIVAILLVRRFLVRRYERHVEPLIDGDPNT